MSGWIQATMQQNTIPIHYWQKFSGKSHNEDKPFPCRLCDKTFEDNTTANFDPLSKKFLDQSDTKKLLIVVFVRKNSCKRTRSKQDWNKKTWKEHLFCLKPLWKKGNGIENFIANDDLDLICYITALA
jgi:hypothetical protein